MIGIKGKVGTIRDLGKWTLLLWLSFTLLYTTVPCFSPGVHTCPSQAEFMLPLTPGVDSMAQVEPARTIYSLPTPSVSLQKFSNTEKRWKKSQWTLTPITSLLQLLTYCYTCLITYLAPLSSMNPSYFLIHFQIICRYHYFSSKHVSMHIIYWSPKFVIHLLKVKFTYNETNNSYVCQSWVVTISYTSMYLP